MALVEPLQYVASGPLEDAQTLAKFMEEGDKEKTTAMLSDAFMVPVLVKKLSVGEVTFECCKELEAHEYAKFFTVIKKDDKAILAAVGVNSPVEELGAGAGGGGKSAAPALPANAAAKQPSGAGGAASSGYKNPFAVSLELVILNITLNGRSVVSREAAKEWVLSTVGEWVLNSIKKAIPLQGGRKLAIHLQNVAESDVESRILPALEAQGQVTRFTTDEATAFARREAGAREQFTQRRDAVGDLPKTLSVIDGLTRMRGEGGSATKKRRFSDRGMESFARAQRVCGHGLREAKEENPESDNE